MPQARAASADGLVAALRLPLHSIAQLSDPEGNGNGPQDRPSCASATRRATDPSADCRIVAMASVELRQVRKSFGNTQLVHGVDVSLADGEFVVLVGPSGCGKSTLLRMIAGLEEITDGEIRIGERVVNNIPPKQRDIAMVFQNYALYPHMKVIDNMGFSMKLAGRSQQEIRERVDRAAKILGLNDYLERYPRQLSGGQRQRVAMGRAIVRDPQVFLFDEPLSNLDAKLRVQMRTEIKALHQRLKTTSIYVTHDQVEAMTMADRIVVMHDGIVEQIGTPLELYDFPANQFVAGFIGSPAMNFLPGTLRRADGLAWVESDGGVRLPLPALGGGRDGQKVVYGIRPEHLTLDAGGVPAKVLVVEPTGADTFVYAEIGGVPVCATFDERHDFSPDQPIELAPRLEAVHLFDAATGAKVARLD